MADGHMAQYGRWPYGPIWPLRQNWDLFETILELSGTYVVIFMKTEEKTGKKGMVATFPISKFI